jgi:diaminopimelate dehydrogenase
MTLGSKIKVGIVGYGNLGKGVEAALNNQVDMELVAVFTRRSINSIVKENPITRFENIKACKDYIGKIDVMVLCGGSMTDLPAQGPFFAKMFNTVDSFDTHAKIPDYFAEINAVAKKAEKVSIISAGWDPGLFSLNRMMAEAILPEGENYTFWGKGVSQGHSDALRRVQGVKDGVQYTIPMEKAMKKVRSGEEPKLTTREKHLRQCFVVAEKGADLKKIEQEIKKMPNYFADYQTEVNFISEEELRSNHSKMPHGGFVIRSGRTKGDSTHIIEYSLKLESNPEFTANILVAYARGAYRFYKQSQYGAKTVFDVPPAYLSPFTDEELRARLL